MTELPDSFNWKTENLYCHTDCKKAPKNLMRKHQKDVTISKKNLQYHKITEFPPLNAGNRTGGWLSELVCVPGICGTA